MALERLKKNMCLIFLNTGTDSTPVWKRVGKSTILELQLNAKTEDYEFIEDLTPTTELMYYKPDMDQELQTNKGDPAFDYIYGMVQTMPVGENAKSKTLFVFPGDTTEGTGETYFAWQANTTIILDSLSFKDEKVKFKLAYNTVTPGSVVVTAGVPVFTAA